MHAGNHEGSVRNVGSERLTLRAIDSKSKNNKQKTLQSDESGGRDVGLKALA